MANSVLREGQKVPSFALKDQDGKVRRLSDYQGHWLVLYAYPRDLTPGCTVEAEDFTALFGDFERLGVAVLGISPDTDAKHKQFCEKKSLRHILLADPEHETLESLGVWQKKKFMGRESMGVVRSTWLIDPQGFVRATWSPVQVKGHAREVLEKAQQLIDGA